MKYLIASDIHGDLAAARLLEAAFLREGADRLCLLGDLLYHGPRNPLPAAYDPKGVIALLSDMKEKILAVRGNCDTEVDQMVLPFPILADYAVLPLADGRLAYLTHGHRYSGETPPPLMADDVLLQGHTHVAGITRRQDGGLCLNPGSVSLPKENTEPCYLILAGDRFTLCRLADGTVLAEA
jgi:putative phosphoesterase